MFQAERISNQIINKLFQNFISTYLHRQFQSLTDRAARWLTDIPKAIFAKTPFELDYTDKNLWTSIFTLEIDELKVAIQAGMTTVDLQSRLIELQGLIGKYTLSPVIYYQGIQDIQNFLMTHENFACYREVVIVVMKIFIAALHKQSAFIQQCFAGDSVIWLRQLPRNVHSEDIAIQIATYQSFTAPGRYLSLLLHLRDQAASVSQFALVRYSTVKICSLERQGIQPTQPQEVEQTSNSSLVMENELSVPIKSSDAKGLIGKVYKTIGNFAGYIIDNPSQALTLGLATQAVAAAALDLNPRFDKKNESKGFMDDLKQAVSQAQFDKLAQALATGLATTAKVSEQGLPLNVVPNRHIRQTMLNTAYRQFPAVANLMDGGFVITWQQNSTVPMDWDIEKETYNSSFASPGYYSDVNTYITNDQEHPAVSGLNNGDYIVTWQSDGQDGSDWGVYGQLYDTSSNPIGSEFRINSYTNNDQLAPAAAGATISTTGIPSTTTVISGSATTAATNTVTTLATTATSTSSSTTSSTTPALGQTSSTATTASAHTVGTTTLITNSLSSAAPMTNTISSTTVTDSNIASTSATSRPISSDSTPSSNTNNRNIIIGCTVAGSVGIVASAVAVGIWKNRKNKKIQSKQGGDSERGEYRMGKI